MSEPLTRKEFERIVSALMVREPAIALLLLNTPVYVTDEDTVAYTDSKAVYVGKKFAGFSPPEKAAVLAHEALHVFLMHNERFKDFAKTHSNISEQLLHRLFNIAADAIINETLRDQGFKLPSNVVWMADVAMLTGKRVDELRKMSVEEIVQLMLKIAKKNAKRVAGMKCPWRDITGKTTAEAAPGAGKAGKGEKEKGGGKGAEEKKEGKEAPSAGRKIRKVNEGSPELEKAGSEEDLRNTKRKILSEAVAAAKVAGKLPAGLARLVDRILESKVDWRRLLRSGIERGFGRQIWKTWARPSRKTPYLRPWVGTLGLGRVIALVDTSGSISEEMLQQMMGEIAAIARQVSEKVIVIPWDAEAYEPIEIKTPMQVKNITVTGGGGTRLKPAVDKALGIARPGDIVVVLSDFYTEESPETVAELVGMLRRATRRKPILVKVNSGVKLPLEPGEAVVVDIRV